MRVIGPGKMEWLEYWNVGILDLDTLFHFSTIPLFQSLLPTERCEAYESFSMVLFQPIRPYLPCPGVRRSCAGPSEDRHGSAQQQHAQSLDRAGTGNLH